MAHLQGHHTLHTHTYTHTENLMESEWLQGNRKDKNWLKLIFGKIKTVEEITTNFFLFVVHICLYISKIQMAT